MTDQNNPENDAILIQRDIIQAIGNQDDFLSEIRAGADIIDAADCVVAPGFIDAHNHFTSMGMQDFEINLEGMTAKKDILARIQAEHHKLNPKRPLICNSYEIDFIHPARRITATDLDEVAPGRMIQITDRSGHMSVCNRFTLEKANINPDDNDCACPKNPEIFTGEICGRANTQLFYFIMKELQTETNLKIAWKQAAEFAVSRGVTSIHFMCPEENYPFILAYRDCLPLHLRVYAETKDIKMVQEAGLNYFGGCGRMIVDGDTGPFTAAFREPYIDRPDTCGRLFYSDEELNDLVWQAHSAGMQLALHCVGDAASEQVINAIEIAINRSGKRLRHRIEHFEFAGDDLKDRVKELDICLSIQPSFNHFWPHYTYVESLGAKRASLADPINSLTQRKIPVGFGSDCTVTPCDPLLTIHAAVNHTNPAERISARRALRCHTMGAAYIGMEENQRGSIAVGKKADFVLLDANPAEVDPKTIRDIPVRMTIANGEIVYKNSR